MRRCDIRGIEQQPLQLLFGLLEIISLLSVYSVNAFINNNSVPGKLAKIAIVGAYTWRGLFSEFYGNLKTNLSDLSVYPIQT